MKRLLLIGAALALTLIQANAATITFERIEPGNAPENIEAQLTVEVTAGGSGVLFKFLNNVGVASSISEVYFDDGLLGPLTVFQEVGCDFTAGSANPGNLPGGETLVPEFEVTALFLADAQGNPNKGVNGAAEFVTFTCGFGSLVDLDGVLGALEDGSLRIGLHVRSIGEDEESDAFINVPYDSPDPEFPDGGATVLLLGAALTGLGLFRNRLLGK